jgi:hypothetical protein
MKEEKKSIESELLSTFPLRDKESETIQSNPIKSRSIISIILLSTLLFSSLMLLTCLLSDMHTGVFGLSTATTYAPTVSLPSAGLGR